MLKEKDLVGIAKRENNNKRKYLVVNRLQAKHIPVSPGQALELFDDLAQIVKEAYGDEKMLLVGFAETATAIGARVAVVLNSYYMQTTRESYEGVQYLFFTESHSHATEQKLIWNDIEKNKDKVQKIIFIEDEVTTGNTILGIIDRLEEEYPDRFSFAVASLLNGMDEEALVRYEQRSIGVHYLLKTDHRAYTERADGYRGDGQYHQKMLEDREEVSCIDLLGNMDARRWVLGAEYEKACEYLWRQIEKQIAAERYENILVLGTEEFMYPAIYAADQLERCGKTVKCHATTRSPIVVSGEEDYPLHTRYELASLYESGRTTFVYNLARYDCVIIITDARNNVGEGANSLRKALRLCGNENIYLFRWLK